MNNNYMFLKKIMINGIVVIVVATVSIIGWQFFENSSKSLSVYDSVVSPSYNSLGLPEFSGSSGSADYGEVDTKMIGESIISPTSNSGVDLNIKDRKVVKNGNLSIVVKNAEESAKQVAEVANLFDGVLSLKEVREVRDGVKMGRVTINVPADKFDEAMEAVKKVATKVDHETINSHDVTEEFVDLEARLKNLKSEETQYLRIMETAKTVEETLRVSQRLFNTRGQIESLEGRIKYLSLQVDFSSINVNLTAEEDVEVLGLTWRPLVVAKFALRDTLNGLANYVDTIIKFIIFLPVIIIWLITLVIVVVVLKRLILWLRNKFIRKSTTKNDNSISGE